MPKYQVKDLNSRVLAEQLAAIKKSLSRRGIPTAGIDQAVKKLESWLGEFPRTRASPHPRFNDVFIQSYPATESNDANLLAVIYHVLEAPLPEVNRLQYRLLNPR
jgi:hypothetical protein